MIMGVISSKNHGPHSMAIGERTTKLATREIGNSSNKGGQYVGRTTKRMTGTLGNIGVTTIFRGEYIAIPS